MKTAQAATQAGVTVKALKYYESLGLIEPSRARNGYRHFSDHDVALVRQIKDLTFLGLSVKGTRPFVDCLRQGHAVGDQCAESLAAYRREIQRLDALIVRLISSRDQLTHQLHVAASRGFPTGVPREEPTPVMAERYGLPDNLPTPLDDGSAAHLPGVRVPALSLMTSDGRALTLDNMTDGRWIIFVYPTTGVPGEDMPRGWDEIPGARGCSPEACGFRDHIGALRQAGVQEVFGLSVQESSYQQELVRRLRLPYALLSDHTRALGAALTLPTFEVAGSTYYKRLTLVLRGDTIEHVFFPIFPPHEHAARVLAWVVENPVHRSGDTA